MGDFVRWYSPRDWVQAEGLDEEGNVTVKGLSQEVTMSLVFIFFCRSAEPAHANPREHVGGSLAERQASSCETSAPTF